MAKDILKFGLKGLMGSNPEVGSSNFFEEYYPSRPTRKEPKFPVNNLGELAYSYVESSRKVDPFATFGNDPVLAAAMFGGYEAVTEYFGEGLGWKDPDGKAELYASTFLNTASSCKGNRQRMYDAARDYHDVCGIPIDEALERIEEATRRLTQG